MTTVTKIQFPSFKSMLVDGRITQEDKLKIKKILKTMAVDEYAGYSPIEQQKRSSIEKILSKYPRLDVLTINRRL